MNHYNITLTVSENYYMTASLDAKAMEGEDITVNFVIPDEIEAYRVQFVYQNGANKNYTYLNGLTQHQLTAPYNARGFLRLQLVFDTIPDGKRKTNVVWLHIAGSVFGQTPECVLLQELERMAFVEVQKEVETGDYVFYSLSGDEVGRIEPDKFDPTFILQMIQQINDHLSDHDDQLANIYTKDEVYNKEEIDAKIEELEYGIEWKQAVPTYDDLAIRYPNPEEGWTALVLEDGRAYTWNGTEWVMVTAGTILHYASDEDDGIITAEQFRKYENYANELAALQDIRFYEVTTELGLLPIEMEMGEIAAFRISAGISQTWFNFPYDHVGTIFRAYTGVYYANITAMSTTEGWTRFLRWSSQTATPTTVIAYTTSQMITTENWTDYIDLTPFALAADLDNYALVDHASATREHGIGTADLFGHVKLSDVITQGSNVASGIAATPKAVYDVVVGLETGKATIQALVADWVPQLAVVESGILYPFYGAKVWTNQFFNEDSAVYGFMSQTTEDGYVFVFASTKTLYVVTYNAVLGYNVIFSLPYEAGLHIQEQFPVVEANIAELYDKQATIEVTSGTWDPLTELTDMDVHDTRNIRFNGTASGALFQRTTITYGKLLKESDSLYMFYGWSNAAFITYQFAATRVPREVANVDIVLLYQLAERNATNIDTLFETTEDHENRIVSLEDRADTNDTDIQDIKDAATALESRVTGTEGRLDSAETRLDDAETRLGEHDVYIQTINNDLGNVHSELDDHEERVTTLETRADNNDDAVSGLGTALNALQNRVSTAETNITTNTNDISGLDGRLTSNEQRTTQLEDRASVNENNIETLQNGLTDANATLNQTIDRVTTNEGDISALQTRATNIEGAATALTGRVAQNETDIAQLQTEVSTAQDDITALEGDVTTINTALTNIYTKDETYSQGEVDNLISALQYNTQWKEAVDTFDDLATTYPSPENGWTVLVKDVGFVYVWDGTEWVQITAGTVLDYASASTDGIITSEQFSRWEGYDASITTNEANIAANASDITQLRTDLTAAEGNIGTIQTNITAIEGNVTDNANAITALEAKTDATNNDLSELDSRVTSNAQNIDTAVGDITRIDGEVTTINQTLTDHVNDDIIHITADERAYWNGKANSYIAAGFGTESTDEYFKLGEIVYTGTTESAKITGFFSLLTEETTVGSDITGEFAIVSRFVGSAVQRITFTIITKNVAGNQTEDYRQSMFVNYYVNADGVGLTYELWGKTNSVYRSVRYDGISIQGMNGQDSAADYNYQLFNPGTSESAAPTGGTIVYATDGYILEQLTGLESGSAKYPNGVYIDTAAWNPSALNLDVNDVILYRAASAFVNARTGVAVGGFGYLARAATTNWTMQLQIVSGGSVQIYQLQYQSGSWTTIPQNIDTAVHVTTTTWDAPDIGMETYDLRPITFTSDASLALFSVDAELFGLIYRNANDEFILDLNSKTEYYTIIRSTNGIYTTNMYSLNDIFANITALQNRPTNVIVTSTAWLPTSISWGANNSATIFSTSATSNAIWGVNKALVGTIGRLANNVFYVSMSDGALTLVNATYESAAWTTEVYDLSDVGSGIGISVIDTSWVPASAELEINGVSTISFSQECATQFFGIASAMRGTISRTSEAVWSVFIGGNDNTVIIASYNTNNWSNIGKYDLDGLTTRLAAVIEKTDGMELTVAELEAEFGTLQYQMGELSNIVDSVQNRMADFDMVVTGLQSDVSRIDNNVAAVTNAVTGLQTRMTDAETNIGLHGNRLTALEDKDTDLQNQINQNTADIATNAENIDTNADAITAVANRVTPLEAVAKPISVTQTSWLPTASGLLENQVASITFNYASSEEIFGTSERLHGTISYNGNIYYFSLASANGVLVEARHNKTAWMNRTIYNLDDIGLQENGIRVENAGWTPDQTTLSVGESTTIIFEGAFTNSIISSLGNAKMLGFISRLTTDVYAFYMRSYNAVAITGALDPIYEATIRWISPNGNPNGWFFRTINFADIENRITALEDEVPYITNISWRPSQLNMTEQSTRTVIFSASYFNNNFGQAVGTAVSVKADILCRLDGSGNKYYILDMSLISSDYKIACTEAGVYSTLYKADYAMLNNMTTQYNASSKNQYVVGNFVSNMPGNISVRRNTSNQLVITIPAPVMVDLGVRGTEIITAGQFAPSASYSWPSNGFVFIRCKYDGSSLYSWRWVSSDVLETDEYRDVAIFGRFDTINNVTCVTLNGLGQFPIQDEPLRMGTIITNPNSSINVNATSAGFSLATTGNTYVHEEGGTVIAKMFGVQSVTVSRSQVVGYELGTTVLTTVLLTDLPTKKNFVWIARRVARTDWFEGISTQNDYIIVNGVGEFKVDAGTSSILVGHDTQYRYSNGTIGVLGDVL